MGKSANVLPIKRSLPGIDFNIENQLLFLKNFNYQDELNEISLLPSN